MVLTLEALSGHPSSPVRAKSQDALRALEQIAGEGHDVDVSSLKSAPLGRVIAVLQDVRSGLGHKGEEGGREAAVNLDTTLGKVLAAVQELAAESHILGSSLEAFDYIPPNAQDLLLSDLTTQDLHGAVAEMLAVKYLQEVEARDTQLPITGVLYGNNYRPMINLVVQSRKKAVNVIFLVDTGSPYTYMCRQALEALGYTEAVPQAAHVTILHVSCEVHLSTPGSHYSDINVLGMHSLSRMGVDLLIKPRELKVYLIGPATGPATATM